MARKWGKRRDDGGSMLASIVIIVLGTGLCCFLCLMDQSEFSDLMLIALPGTSLLAIILIVAYRYGRSDSGSLIFWHSAATNHNDDGIAGQYRPEKVKDRRANTPVGTNQPITAEEAHDLQTMSSNTWVPSKKRGEK
jgi:hypothetical protein